MNPRRCWYAGRQWSPYEMLLISGALSREETVLCHLTGWLVSTSHSAADGTKDWKMELQLPGIELCFNI